MRVPMFNQILRYCVIAFVIVVIFTLVIESNYLKQRFKTADTEFTTEDSLEIYQEKHFPKQHSVVVDFKGLESDKIKLPVHAIKIISSELDSLNWNAALELEDLHSLYHQTIFVKRVPSNRGTGKNLIVITYSNSTANLCHACKGKISLFEFQGKTESLRLIRKYIGFAFGDEDATEPRGLELVRIGSNNRYAVIIHTGYSYMGHEQETKSIYTEINDSMKPVFDFTCYEYYFDPPPDIEYIDGHSNFRIIESSKEFFDIETKNEDTEWGDKTPGAVKRFEFNGKKYVEI